MWHRVMVQLGTSHKSSAPVILRKMVGFNRFLSSCLAEEHMMYLSKVMDILSEQSSCSCVSHFDWSCTLGLCLPLSLAATRGWSPLSLFLNCRVSWRQTLICSLLKQ
eukprot:Rmarinus@m.17075